MRLILNRTQKQPAVAMGEDRTMGKSRWNQIDVGSVRDIKRIIGREQDIPTV